MNTLLHYSVYKVSGLRSLYNLYLLRCEINLWGKYIDIETIPKICGFPGRC